MVQSQKYNVCLQTPIGSRYGIMKVKKERSQIFGSLDVLRHSEPFSGTISEDGSCEITGKIVTLIRQLTYIATGKIIDGRLNLSISIGHNTFKMTGCIAELEEGI